MYSVRIPLPLNSTSLSVVKPVSVTVGKQILTEYEEERKDVHLPAYSK